MVRKLAGVERLAVDGEPAGSGSLGLYPPYGAKMNGGSVRPKFRGRGVYRALVAARVEIARRPGVRGLGKWIAIAASVAGLGAIGFGLSRSVWLSIPLMMMVGFGMFMTGATCNTILQTMVHEDKRSRVMSYYTMFFIGVAPLGHYTAGWLAEHIGAPATFVAGGAVALATGLVFASQLGSFRSHLRLVYVSRGIIPASETTQIGNP